VLKDLNVRVLIPARSGSKGVPDKNIRELSGKPLVDHTIFESLKVFPKDHIYLSSDGDEILERGLKYGIQVLKRPKEISQDHSSSNDLISHFLQSHNFLNNQIIIYLQPTSPLRKAIHIRNSFELYKEVEKGTVMSVSESKQTPYKTYKLDPNNHLIPMFDKDIKSNNRQAFPSTYYPNGAIYIFKSNFFLAEGFMPEPKIPFFMTAQDSIDIDDKLDFHIANFLMETLDGI